MSKFKVGDVVECIRNVDSGGIYNGGAGFKLGRIFTIHSILDFTIPCYFPKDESGVYEPWSRLANQNNSVKMLLKKIK